MVGPSTIAISHEPSAMLSAACSIIAVVMLRLRSTLFALALVALTAGPAASQSLPDDFFESRIRPVLSTRCYACHSSKLAAPKGELVLDTKAGVLKGGKLGPAILPGNPSESRLLTALRYTDPHLQMP